MSVEEDSDGKRRWKAPADSRPPAGGRTMAKKEKVRKKTLGKSSREWVDRQPQPIPSSSVRAKRDTARVPRGCRSADRARNSASSRKVHASSTSAARRAGGCRWRWKRAQPGSPVLISCPVEPVGEATIFLGDIYEPGHGAAPDEGARRSTDHRVVRHGREHIRPQTDRPHPHRRPRQKWPLSSRSKIS